MGLSRWRQKGRGQIVEGFHNHICDKKIICSRRNEEVKGPVLYPIRSLFFITDASRAALHD